MNPSVRAAILIAFIVTTFGTLTAVAVFRYSKQKSTIVLPGGITYLGPSPATDHQIAIPPSTNWVTYKGRIFPYSFMYPETLSLGVFPNDPLDAVTIFWGNTDARANLLLRVEELNQPITKYVENWWRQYNWTGIKSITEFTNSRGLKGYRAKYLDTNGNTPFDNVFLEVPGRPDLVIWMASSLLQPAVFDKIVDSVSWTK